METYILVRNTIIRWKYKWFLKPILFRFDPEVIHDFFIKIGKFLGQYGLTRWATKTFFYYENQILEQEVLGLKFKNPVGLAAGFDKNAEMIDIMPAVGFGFMEIGSVTGRPCAGNPKPRLWRLVKSKSLIVYYGLKNNGCKEIAERLVNQSAQGGSLREIPLGISIAKTNDEKTVTTEEGIADYKSAYETFVQAGIGDYYVINISCPNAFGGEPFIAPEKLDKLLLTLGGETSEWAKPVFIKMPPDLNNEQIDQIIELAIKYKISGFVCTNLSKDRSLPSFQNTIKEKLPTDKGGLSGKVVEKVANQQIRYIYKKAGKEFAIIGCGGIFNAQDAYIKIKAGASLVQLITGMIFEGPQLIGEINQGLAELLKKDGYKNIKEAVGRE